MGQRLRPVALGAAGIVLFLVAVRVLGTAVDWMAPAVRDVVPRLMVLPASALGVGWTLTYLLLNGSVVAALAVTLAAGGALDVGETFLMVAGSRLGAASFVILVGFFDHYRSPGRQTLRGALGLGLLAIRGWGDRLTAAAGGLDLPVPSLEFLAPAVRELLGAGGAIPVFLLAMALLVAAVRLGDRALRSVDRERLQRRYLSRLGNRWVSFGLGLGLTLLTASVAFSVGILVPLYNRGHLSRKAAVPYLLGANLGTLADTYLVTSVLRTEAGGAAVVTLWLSAAGITLVALLGYPAYRAFVDRVVDAVTFRRLSFAAVGACLVAAPLVLAVVPLL